MSVSALLHERKISNAVDSKFTDLRADRVSGEAKLSSGPEKVGKLRIMDITKEESAYKRRFRQGTFYHLAHFCKEKHVKYDADNLQQLIVFLEDHFKVEVIVDPDGNMGIEVFDDESGAYKFETGSEHRAAKRAREQFDHKDDLDSHFDNVRGKFLVENATKVSEGINNHHQQQHDACSAGSASTSASSSGEVSAKRPNVATSHFDSEKKRSREFWEEGSEYATTQSWPQATKPSALRAGFLLTTAAAAEANASDDGDAKSIASEPPKKKRKGTVDAILDSGRAALSKIKAQFDWECHWEKTLKQKEFDAKMCSLRSHGRKAMTYYCQCARKTKGLRGSGRECFLFGIQSSSLVM